MPMPEQRNYYALLGVEPDASQEAISAAYAAIRRQIPAEAGQDPRVQQLAYAFEVLSNPDRRALYDSLLQEAAGPALRVRVRTSREQLAILDSPQLVYFLVDVQPPQQEEDTRLPLNICLVIDRSTSMRGERLDQVKMAVETMVDQLGPADVVSVIGFSDRAEVLVPVGPVQHKMRVIARIQSMIASGGTEIFQGLMAGVEEMQQVSLDQYTNHLILLTDGHTYGDTDACLKLARQIAAEGIGISAFGIGVEWNDQFLDRLVSPSGGQSGFIDQPTQILGFLQNRLKGLGAIYARNVRLLLEFPQSVSLRYGFKLAPYAQPLSVGGQALQLGDIEGRRPLAFLLELAVDPQPAESRLRVPIHLVADVPGHKPPEKRFRQEAELMVLAEAKEMKPPDALLRAVRMLNMYRLNEKVWDDLSAGEMEVAATRMRHLTTRFLEAGQTGLAQQASVEAERLAQVGELSAEGRKALKFGTRALLSQTANWEE